jgi:hypothetical protein
MASHAHIVHHRSSPPHTLAHDTRLEAVLRSVPLDVLVQFYSKVTTRHEYGDCEWTYVDFSGARRVCAISRSLEIGTPPLLSPPRRSTGAASTKVDLFHVVFLLCLRGGGVERKIAKKLCISAIENSRIGLSLRASLEAYPPCIQ